MKTVVYRCQNNEYVVDEIDMPSAADHDLVLEVKACALTVPPTKLMEDLFSKKNSGSLSVGYEVAGVVSEVGSKVTRCKQGDRVAGLIPLDSCSGCADFCVISEYNIVRVAESVDFVTAAVAMGDGVRAHTALHYQAGVGVGDTVLVIGGAWGSGSTIIQLALQWGAKVLTTSSSMQEKAYLESLQPAPAHVIEVGERTGVLVSAVLEETGGLGADVIVDCGVRLFPDHSEPRVVGDADFSMMPTKHEMLSCLAVGGHWITSHHALQLDPPDAQRLFLSGASLSFLFPHTWTLSSSQQGRLLHMLESTMRLVSSGDLRPQVSQEVSLSQVPRVMTSLTSHTQGRVVMTSHS